jgi:pimeloyl-ACP methyl ester carboxylesterase
MLQPIAAEPTRETNITTLTRAHGRMPTVVALHCSGTGAFEWRQLTHALGQHFQVIAPNLIGCGAVPHWSGAHAFTASDEAAPIIDIIDAAEEPVHLVGHSYGGGVALRVARERPSRIATLTLYEPVALHLLKAAGPEEKAAFNEVAALAAQIDHAILCGAYWPAAEQFVDYWNGEGAFRAMEQNVQASVVRYMPKASLEFRAMADERTPLEVYRSFHFPTLLLVGERSFRWTRLIDRQLANAMKFASHRTVSGAGHMGPFTHQEIVNASIADHIVRTEHDAADSPFRRGNAMGAMQAS